MTQANESPTAGATTAGHEKETNYNNSNLPLYPHHLQKLTQEHGHSEKTIEEAGLFSADAKQLNHILKRNDIKCNGIGIPYTENFIRARLDEPIILNGNEAKYLSPSGYKNRLYIPKPVIPVLTYPTATLFFHRRRIQGTKIHTGRSSMHWPGRCMGI